MWSGARVTLHQLRPLRSLPLVRAQQDWDDTFDRLFDYRNAVGIVALNLVGAHVREHRHDVVQDRLWSQTGQSAQQQKGILSCPWVRRVWRTRSLVSQRSEGCR